MPRGKKSGAVSTSRDTTADGLSSSGSSNRGLKSKKDSGKKKTTMKSKTAMKAKTTMKSKTNARNLTVARLARIIRELNRKDGSTLQSIRSKATRSGFNTNAAHMRTVVKQAVDSGLLRQVREERFTLPGLSVGSGTSSKGAGKKRAPNKASNKKLTPSASAKCSASAGPSASGRSAQKK